MPFVLPMTDQDAENARLLDRLTKQQEINQSLRAENAQLKATLINYRGAMDDIEKWSADLEDINDILPELKKLTERIEKLKDEFAGWKASYDDDIREARAEGIDEKDAKIEKLKAELLDINMKHRRDTQKTCLKAKFDTWREGQVKYNSDYNIEDEAFWLVGEATNIQDAIEIFNEVYEDGGGYDYTWKLECDHQRKWELDQWWMDEETGEYTLTEAEFEAQNQEDNDPEEYGEYTWKQGLTAEEIAKGDTINPETGEALAEGEKGGMVVSWKFKGKTGEVKISEKPCDFCDKARQVLTKRDAGYDEWTCSTCHEEQYPEQYEEKQ